MERVPKDIQRRIRYGLGLVAFLAGCKSEESVTAVNTIPEPTPIAYNVSELRKNLTLLSPEDVAYVRQLRFDLPAQAPEKTPKDAEVNGHITPLVDPAIVPKECSVTGQKWTGRATYYSVDGCVGCSPDRIMKNGEPLDDNRRTIAFFELPMNSLVVVRNNLSGNQTLAEVTDHGGFRPNLADLSVATRNAINGRDTTDVSIYELACNPRLR